MGHSHDTRFSRYECSANRGEFTNSFLCVPRLTTFLVSHAELKTLHRMGEVMLRSYLDRSEGTAATKPTNVKDVDTQVHMISCVLKGKLITDQNLLHECMYVKIYL